LIQEHGRKNARKLGSCFRQRSLNMMAVLLSSLLASPKSSNVVQVSLSCGIPLFSPPNPGMSLRGSCRLISASEKDPTTSSNCTGKQRHGVILTVQLSEKAGLTYKNACLAFP